MLALAFLVPFGVAAVGTLVVIGLFSDYLIAGYEFTRDVGAELWEWVCDNWLP